MEEIWKDIEGYEGLYQVSNYGRILSLGNGKTHKNKHYLKLVNNGSGYKIVSLSKKGVIKNYTVHYLVATAFIPNPNNYPQIDHIVPVQNGGTNASDNLRWVTVKTNANNPISLKNKSKSQLKSSLKKSKSMIGKCTRQLLQYDKNWNLLNSYSNIKYTCIENNWNYSTITNAINKKTTAYGYYWGSTSQNISVSS